MRFIMPEAWDLGKVEGGTNSGYLRIDDLKMQRMEIRWGISRSRYPVSGLVDKYLKRFSGSIENSERDLKNYPGLGGFNGEYEVFTTKSSTDESVLLSRRCDDCGRIVLVRVIFERDKCDTRLSKRIFASFRDHSDSDRNLWSVFDFSFSIGKKWLVRKSSFLAGRINLGFVYEKKDEAFGRNDTLNVERISMAEIVLKGKRVDDWFVHDYLKNRISKKAEKRERIFSDHSMHVFVEREKGIFAGSCVFSFVWKCDEENKIFVLRLFTKKEIAEDAVLDGFYCHGDV